MRNSGAHLKKAGRSEGSAPRRRLYAWGAERNIRPSGYKELLRLRMIRSLLEVELRAELDVARAEDHRRLPPGRAVGPVLIQHRRDIEEIVRVNPRLEPGPAELKVPREAQVELGNALVEQRLGGDQ